MIKLKHIWLVYQNDKMDFVATNLEQAKEMACDAESECRRRFKIERWILKNGKYQFEKSIPNHC